MGTDFAGCVLTRKSTPGRGVRPRNVHDQALAQYPEDDCLKLRRGRAGRHRQWGPGRAWASCRLQRTSAWAPAWRPSPTAVPRSASAAGLASARPATLPSASCGPQSVFAMGHFGLQKHPGSQNPADMLTKGGQPGADSSSHWCRRAILRGGPAPDGPASGWLQLGLRASPGSRGMSAPRLLRPSSCSRHLPGSVAAPVAKGQASCGCHCRAAAAAPGHGPCP